MGETITIGGLKLEVLHSKDDTDGSLDVSRMTVQSNARVPVPHYPETWDETVYGLSGTLSFRGGHREIELSPGDSIFIRRGVVHGFGNTSPEPATCLSVLMPDVLGTA